DRYTSPANLAQDVERWLADEPVSAWHEPWVVRVRRWLGRHLIAVGTAAATVLIAVLGLALGLIWERDAKEAAIRARQDAEKSAEEALEANEQAQKRLAQVQKGSEILTSIFTDLDPRAEVKEGKPLRAILGDQLVKAAEQLEGDGVGDPLLMADLQNRLGQ